MLTKKSTQNITATGDRMILVMGANHQWAKAKTFNEAYRKASRPAKFIVFDVSPDTYINDMGDIVYPPDHKYVRLGENF